MAYDYDDYFRGRNPSTLLGPQGPGYGSGLVPGYQPMNDRSAVGAFPSASMGLGRRRMQMGLGRPPWAMRQFPGYMYQGMMGAPQSYAGAVQRPAPAYGQGGQEIGDAVQQWPQQPSYGKKMYSY
jgi:hypothetical protein